MLDNELDEESKHYGAEKISAGLLELCMEFSLSSASHFDFIPHACMQHLHYYKYYYNIFSFFF